MIGVLTPISVPRGAAFAAKIMLIQKRASASYERCRLLRVNADAVPRPFEQNMPSG